MKYIIVFFATFIIFFLYKFIITLFYDKRYYKVLLIDSLIVSFYIVGIIGIENYYNSDLPDVGRILLFWFLIPSIYAFIKPKILRRYCSWEVGMYYPITEFLTIILGVISSLFLIASILDLVKDFSL